MLTATGESLDYLVERSDELRDEGDTQAARDILERALLDHGAQPQLLWALVEVDFDEQTCKPLWRTRSRPAKRPGGMR
jgi:hypothetical protein